MASPGQVKRIAGRKARKYGINPRIFKRQIRQESGYRDVRSPAGAQGPAQIMPATAASWGVRNVHNPREALDAAAKHMAEYLRAYHGSWAKALTAYNAGPGAVGGHLPAETQNYIRTILGGGDVKNLPGRSGSGGGSIQTAIPGRWSVKLRNQQQFDAPAFKQARNAFVVGNLIAKHRGTDNPLFKTGLLSTTAPSPGDFRTDVLSSSLVKHAGRIVTSGGGGANIHGSNVQAMLARAEAWDRAKVPYSWGGGHGSRPAKPGTPVDCSGYVSAILGVNPMVSGALANWGRPGRGKQVTVYANSGHVLINIGHRWFATSHSNPGGGAGEISRPSASYLAAFRARHPRGL